MLQATIAKMPQQDAIYYMKKCVDAGLWVPGKNDKEPTMMENAGAGAATANSTPATNSTTDDVDWNVLNMECNQFLSARSNLMVNWLAQFLPPPTPPTSNDDNEINKNQILPLYPMLQVSCINEIYCSTIYINHI